MVVGIRLGSMGLILVVGCRSLVGTAFRLSLVSSVLGLRLALTPPILTDLALNLGFTGCILPSTTISLSTQSTSLVGARFSL